MQTIPTRPALHLESAPRYYRFGAADLRVAERQLLIDGKAAELGARAFDVLVALVENRGRVVSKDELLQFAWPGTVVEENNLQQQISTLRKLLGQQAISTVPGRGYQFTLEESVPNSTPAVGVLPLADPRSTPTATIGRTLIVGIALACAVAALAGALTWWSQSRHAANQTAPGLISIAVLPFANLTGDPDQAYVADGLTAALTHDLSRIRDAYIVDASTSYAYKSKPVLAKEVGAQLGVKFVLMGSVQRSKDTIRFHAQLDDTTSGAQLWSDTFDGDASDLFALEDRVTTRIVNSIDQTMVVAAARDSEKRKSNPQAAELILRAWALVMTPYSDKRNKKMEELYRQALASEPDNAAAMAGLASVLAVGTGLSGSGHDHSAREKQLEEARALALQAKNIDPSLPGIYVGLGTYAHAHDDFAAYKRANETRLALEPKNPISYANLAEVYFQAGEPKRALELLRQAEDLHPKNPRFRPEFLLAGVYLMLGDYDKCIQYSLKAIEKYPTGPYIRSLMAMSYARKGDEAKAHALAAEVRRIAPDFKLSSLEKPQPSFPDASKEYWDKKFVPAWRLAGLPE